jgi:hypothetical protein
MDIIEKLVRIADTEGVEAARQTFAIYVVGIGDRRDLVANHLGGIVQSR